jgi:hypothetical protein
MDYAVDCLTVENLAHSLCQRYMKRKGPKKKSEVVATKSARVRVSTLTTNVQSHPVMVTKSSDLRSQSRWKWGMVLAS